METILRKEPPESQQPKTQNKNNHKKNDPAFVSTDDSCSGRCSASKSRDSHHSYLIDLRASTKRMLQKFDDPSHTLY
jgi:hypothetical protein